MDDQEREQDLFRLNGGAHRDPSSLPPHLKNLHRRIQRHARKDRQQGLTLETHDERRWPGLVNPEEQEQ